MEAVMEGLGIFFWMEKRTWKVESLILCKNVGAKLVVIWITLLK